MKVIITVPDLGKRGGVASLFNLLKLDNEDCTYFSIDINYIKIVKFRLVNLFFMYIHFIFKIIKFDVVHVNPSMNSNSYYRDLILVLISKLFNKNILVYWHGWDSIFFSKITSNSISKVLYNISYGKANVQVVLGECFKKELMTSGLVQTKVIVESNTASDEYLDDRLIIKNIDKTNEIHLLFIARLIREKGIYVALNLLSILKNKYNIKLHVAGDGPELINIQNYIKTNNLNDNVIIYGNVQGKDKHMLLQKCHIMILPTNHNEGMPVSILEGMLYGMPIISKNVGGIPDWVDDFNGFITDKDDFNEYQNYIEELLLNNKYINISLENQRKSRSYFIPKMFKERLYEYYSQV